MKISLFILSSILICFGFFGCKGEPLEANFSATPTEGEVPVEVQFTDQSVGEIDQWQWDFDNDGVIDSTLQNPTHTYDKPGTYSVNLTVSNSSGTAHTTGHLVFFLPLKADFMAEPTEVVGFRNVRFYDTSQGNITSWAWDFDGDGVVDSTEPSPIYQYTLNGDYTVTLTIKGPRGEQSITKPDYIHVSSCGG